MTRVTIGREDVSGSSMDPLARHIGYELFGPVIHRWLLGLHQYRAQLDDDNTVFLYCARAGVRIERLYQMFLKGSGLAPIGNDEMLWASRIAICKGTFAQQEAPAAHLLATEYRYEPLRSLIEGVFRYSASRIAHLDLNRKELSAHGAVFEGWIHSDQEAARLTREYLLESSDNFDLYIARLLDGRNKAVLIDSGWQGTSQNLLTNAFPQVEWYGLYFGRILTPDSNRSIASKVIGLVFEAEKYQPSCAESAFVVHRHSIETLLEPNAPSVEEVPFGSTMPAAKPLIQANLNEHIGDKDDLYRCVIDYMRDATGISLSEIMVRHQRAMSELARILTQPTREEALAFRCKERSTDFGKKTSVSILLSPTEGAPDTSQNRIGKSLWRQGQIALEYSNPKAARTEQLASLGLTSAAIHFDPLGSAERSDASESPLLSIITRTKDRPLLLHRAAQSVRRQSYQNIEWIVVNDGGDEGAVRQVLESSGVDPRRIGLVSNVSSLGMEAASNLGVRSSAGKYVVIHDDDDSLDPDFARSCVDFLESTAGRRYGGVITHCTYVSEEIIGDSIRIHDRRPYMDWVRNVSLPEMAVSNIFAPIAFVYRRETYDLVGGYNETLPVLGDWYFNIEFLLKADIGVLPRPLANYHHRDTGGGQVLYSNSVNAALSKHEEFASVVVNELLRKHSATSPAVLSVAQGYMLKDTRFRIDSLSDGWAVGMRDMRAPPAGGEAHSYWTVVELSTALLSGRIPRDHASRIAAIIADPVERLKHAELASLAQAADVPINAPDFFDEQKYLLANPDVQTAVSQGQFPTGYMHYLRFGRAEGRAG